MGWHHLLQNQPGSTRSPRARRNQGTRRQRSPTVPRLRPRRHVQSCSQTKYTEAEQIRCVRNPRGGGSTPAPNPGRRRELEGQGHPEAPQRGRSRTHGRGGRAASSPGTRVQAPVLALFSSVSSPVTLRNAQRSDRRFVLRTRKTGGR